jgi:hypothetical protein
MQPSRFRLRDAAVVAAFLAVLLVAGRLHERSLQAGGPAPGRAARPPAAAHAPPAAALPRTLPVVARIALPRRPGPPQGGTGGERAVAAAAGAAWVADGCAVARVGPRSNRVSGWVALGERRGRRGGPCRVLGLGVGPDASAWVATTSALVRADRAARRVAARLALAPSGAPTVAAGAVWVPCCRAAGSARAGLPRGGWLLRVDPGSGRVAARIALAGGHPRAAGAGLGSVWVAGYRDRQDRPGGLVRHAPVLWRVDPATNRVVAAAAPRGRPRALLDSDATPPSVLAEDAAVLVSDPPGGVVWQVDPRRHRFVGRTAVAQGGPLAAAGGVAWAAAAGGLVPLSGPHAGGGGPRLPEPLGRGGVTGLAAGAGALWVATPDALYQVDPRRLR